VDIQTTKSLDDELFAAYAAGALPRSMCLLIETQAHLSNDTSDHVKTAEAISGALLESLEPKAMSDSALTEVFAAIDAEEAAVGEAGSAFSSSDRARDTASVEAAEAAGQAIEELLGLPDSVRDLALESAQWNFAGPGVRKMTLIEEGESKAELIRLEPGSGVPHHGHNCREYTLVLKGAYHDGQARYGVGDLSIADPETIHKPIAEAGEICIALAVTDGPLAFKGALGWIQRTFGG
jgi:putative transcriptional regulator